MGYLETVQAVRLAAEAVNPQGSYYHGRRVDLSEKHRTKLPVIWLYPFNITDATTDQVMNTNNLLIGFWAQDKPSSSVIERETLIAQMDLLCTSFLRELRSNNQISIENVTREPQIQYYQGTLSGIAMSCNLLNVADCD